MPIVRLRFFRHGGATLSLIAAILLIAAGEPDFRPPLGASPRVSGPKSQVLTIGSPHLSGFHDRWNPLWLSPLLDRLSRWKPDVITIENIAGEQCETIRRNPSKYDGTFKSYCFDAQAAQSATGMTQADAENAVEKMLANWSAPTPADRRRLALTFLAAGDRASARVQWLRLAPAERVADGPLQGEILDQLNLKGRKMNESIDVAAVLAARLGHERVWPVDDHTSDGALRDTPQAYSDWQRAHFDAYGQSPMKPINERAEASVKDGPTLLAHYRWLNAANSRNDQIQSDFGAALASDFPGHMGRLYAAWWDVRNLRMVANIRASFAKRPGARVLNIVGASHKPWYDQWMKQMSDVEVVDAEAVLR